MAKLLWTELVEDLQKYAYEVHSEYYDLTQDSDCLTIYKMAKQIKGLEKSQKNLIATLSELLSRAKVGDGIFWY